VLGQRVHGEGHREMSPENSTLPLPSKFPPLIMGVVV